MKIRHSLIFAIFGLLTLASCGGNSGPKTYTVTKIERDATITLEKEVYAQGDTVNFSVMCSKDHYTLVVDDGGVFEVQYQSLGNDRYSFTMPSCNLNIKATGYDDPKPTEYSINLTKDAEIDAVLSKITSYSGETIEIDVTYNGKYTLTIETTYSVPVAYTGSHPHYEFQMPAADVNVTIRKVVPVYYSVETNVDQGITLSGLKEKYEENDEVSFSITASKEYELSILDSSLNVISYTGTNPYSFVMPKANVSINVHFKQEDPLKKKLTFEQRYQKLWESNNVVYNEMVMLYTHEDGNTYGELLYTPTSVTEVKDYLMTKIFKKGVDFTVEGNKIIIKNISTTQMPYLTLDQYNAVPTSLTGTDIGTYQSSKSPSGYVLYSEYPHIVKKTVLVTYEHNGTWDGYKVYQEGNMLPNTQSKLNEKGNFNLAIYGDSNATGAVTSGYWKLDYEGTHPGASTLFADTYDFQEGFPFGFKTALEQIYGVNCTLYNPSEGGQSSGWMNLKPGADDKNLWTGEKYNSNKTRLENWLDDCVPDLVVFVFGNNDISFGVTAENYLNNIVTAINKVKEKNPNAEFIISLPKRSNPLSIQDDTSMSQQYLNIVKKYIDDEESGVAFHDMTTFTSDLLKHKDPYSLFGNGINHSNDFLARQWVSIFMETLQVPSQGNEWKYKDDPTITPEKPDYAKDWVNVVSDSGVSEAPVNIDDGVKLESLSTWGEGYARKEKVYLDGLSFDLRSDNMRYGGSVEYKGGQYLLSTVIGFFFTKEQGNWTDTTAYPFGNFAFNLLDIFNQERVFVGTDNDYNKSTIMYLDENCTQMFSSNATNQMILNRIQNTDGTDRAGLSIKFTKVSETVYSIKIGALLGAYMWENNPNYDATDVSCTYYIKAEAFSGVLAEDGSTYLNIFGYGPEYEGQGYGGNMYATVTNLVSKEPAPIALGDEERTYVSGSRQAIRFYYNPVVSSSTPLGLEKSNDGETYSAIDIAHRTFGVDGVGYYCEITGDGMEYIVNQSGKGNYFIRLVCSNGTCLWRLTIQ